MKRVSCWEWCNFICFCCDQCSYLKNEWCKDLENGGCSLMQFLLVPLLLLPQRRSVCALLLPSWGSCRPPKGLSSVLNKPGEPGAPHVFSPGCFVTLIISPLDTNVMWHWKPHRRLEVRLHSMQSWAVPSVGWLAMLCCPFGPFDCQGSCVQKEIKLRLNTK